MPIYEYECEQCGNVVEALQKFSDKPLTECGNCSGSLQKLISQSSFHLKGSGWYVTDYAGKKQGADTEVKKESKKTDSKPDKSAKTSDKAI
ncbi:zinc ribbon domain-containing protein [Desulfobacterales bacterium HSG16]|nr:zinc ribbon domain-containing protein [Desulfobacterales bacterium HSG16]